MFEPIDRVMKMRQGGSAVPRRTDIGGQDHMLSYITPQEAGILQLLGGSGEPGPAGIPAFKADPDQMKDAQDSLGGGKDKDDDKNQGGGKSYSDLGMSPGQAQAQFGTIGPALFAGAQQDQVADSGFRAKALSDYRDLGVGKGFFGRPTYNSTYDLNMSRNYLDMINRQFGVPSQSEFNVARGITATNPYGYEGVMSRVLGFDPRSVDYSNTMSEKSRRAIGSNYFSKYANPQNIKGRLGFNPDFPDASVETPGQLRPGLAPGLFNRSYDTAYGPTTTYNVKRSPMDSLVLAAMPLGMGILADQLSNKTAGFAPSELFDLTSQRQGALSGGQDTPGFRPANATETGDYSALGSFGQGIGQGIGAFEDAIGGAFTGAGKFFNSLDPDQGKRAAAARAAAQPDLAATDSVFGNFISGVQNKIEGIPAGIAAGVNQVKRGIGSIFQAPDPAPDPVGSVPEIDLAGFESRFAPAPAPETQQLMDAFGMGLPGVQAAAPTSPQTIDSTVSPGRSQAQFNTPKFAGISSSVLDRPSFSDFLEANPLDAASMQARINEISAIQNDLMSKGMSQIRAYSTAKRQVEEREDAEREIQQQSSLDRDRVMDALTGGSGFGVATAAPAFETAGVLDDLGMAVKSLGGDFVEIPGGYMDKKTGKTYSGTPGGSARTFTGTRKKSVQPFSGESFIQNIGSIFGS